MDEYINRLQLQIVEASKKITIHQQLKRDHPTVEINERGEYVIHDLKDWNQIIVDDDAGVFFQLYIYEPYLRSKIKVSEARIRYYDDRYQYTDDVQKAVFKYGEKVKEGYDRCIEYSQLQHELRTFNHKYNP